MALRAVAATRLNGFLLPDGLGSAHGGRQMFAVNSGTSSGFAAEQRVLARRRGLSSGLHIPGFKEN